KEVAGALGRIVREEHIGAVLVGGDDVIVPLLKREFPKELAEKVVDFLKLDARAPEHEILETTMSAIRDEDAAGDRETVEALLDAFRAHGLATIGIERTRQALALGQVDELVIAARPDRIAAGSVARDEAGRTGRTTQEQIGDELIMKASQTDATIRVI